MNKHLLTFLVLVPVQIFSQSTNDILNILIENGTVSQQQADSLRAEAALNQHESEAGKKTFFATAARSIQFAGYTQIRYQYFNEDSRNDGFDVRRARFDVKGKFNSFFSYRLQADFAGSPRLLDAYGEINCNDYLNITVGQFRIPFSLENLTSMNRYELIDYSQAVNAFTARGTDVIGNQNGRDIGVQIGGTLFKRGEKNMLEYRLGVFNGRGINGTDVNKAKDIVARLIVNPVKGLSIGSSWYNGWGKPATAEISQTRNRLGFEAAYTTSGLLLKGEYISGKDGDTEKSGWYAIAGYYIISQKLQVVGKYDSFSPDNSVDDNTNVIYVLGLNFNFNNWSRIQAFYTLSEDEGTPINNDYLSLQFQIGF